MIRPRLSELKLSIRNLWDEFGATDNFIVGATVSIALVIPGILAYLYLGTPYNYVGAVWALLNLLPLVQGVMNL